MAPSAVNTNFDGISRNNCGGCPDPPDPNAAAGPTQIAEVVNLGFEVFDKSGNSLCVSSLNHFLNDTPDVLGDPRIQYDNVNDRFSMSLTIRPSSDTATPAMWIAASQTGDACKPWWIYRLTFSGSAFPAGAVLDFPFLGQDQGALLVSTNNGCCASTNFGRYIDSAAWSVPKSAVYSGAPVNFTTYHVTFATAPVTVAGIPMATTSTTYWLATVCSGTPPSRPCTGYNLYRMTTGGGPVSLQATISAPFTSPPPVSQPGTNVTLSPSDGRIQWQPVQDGSFVWFTHDITASSLPTVRFGAVNVTSNTVQVAQAFHSQNSNDFDPSLGVSDAAGGGNYVWLNWAYTDPSSNVPLSDTVNAVLPGQGVPDEIATDLTLVTGNSYAFTGFGDYSSVAVDPVAAGENCTAGQTAVTTQEYIDTTGNWATRIGRVSFC